MAAQAAAGMRADRDNRVTGRDGSIDAAATGIEGPALRPQRSRPPLGLTSTDVQAFAPQPDPAILEIGGAGRLTS